MIETIAEAIVENISSDSIVILIFLSAIFFPSLAYTYQTLQLNKTMKKLERSITKLIMIEISDADANDLLRDNLRDIK